jgi:cytochrome c oxidase subunit 3
MRQNQKNPFHLVDSSPWPIVAAFGALGLTFGGVLFMHGFVGGTFLFLNGFFSTVFVMYAWFKDVVREGTFEGQHTKDVQVGLRWGMLLFIVSEIMFFFAFFWTFFHASLSPSFDIGGIWTPKGVAVLNPWEVPLVNTVLLLSSGVSITWSHHSLLAGSRKNAFRSLALTVALAIVFLFLQGFEYCTSAFSISSSIYGSVFFLLTGFHGFHVLVGMLFLVVCLVRLVFHQFTCEHHLGFEAAAWYWHFVDGEGVYETFFTFFCSRHKFFLKLFRKHLVSG